MKPGGIPTPVFSKWSNGEDNQNGGARPVEYSLRKNEPGEAVTMQSKKNGMLFFHSRTDVLQRKEGTLGGVNGKLG